MHTRGGKSSRDWMDPLQTYLRTWVYRWATYLALAARTVDIELDRSLGASSRVNLKLQ